MRRRDAEPTPELEALDPLTGETLRGEASSANDGAEQVGTRSIERARRLRLAARALALVGALCAAAAGYFGLSIVHLRGIERSWREAMAVDDARAAADRRVLALLAAAGDDTDEAELAALDPIGDEAAETLESIERGLRDRRIVDRKVSALRDQMVEALEFRRFQMSPQRGRLGNSPLIAVEVALASQLDRWDLDRASVEPPPLDALADQVERLGRFADEETDTVLFGVRRGTELLTIDVDAGTVRSRRLPQPAHELFPVEDGVAVADGIDVVVYPLDPTAEPLVRVPASRAVATGDGTSDLWLLAEDDASLRGTVRRFRPAAGEQPQEAIALPPGRHVSGAATGVLVLADAATGGLELWSPRTRSVTEVLSTSASRFLDGEGDLIAWQGPLEYGNPNSDGFVHRMSVSADRPRDLIGLPRTDAVSGVLTPAGDLVVALGPVAGEFGSVAVAPFDSPALFSARGPRVAVDADALALSPSGDVAFWRTPEGAIAIFPLVDPPNASLLRSGLEGLERLVAIDR